MQSTMSRKSNVKRESGLSIRHSEPGVQDQWNSNAMLLPWGPVTRQRLLRTLLFYICLFLTAYLIQELSVTQRWQAFATGLMSPGAGFLYWANPLADSQMLFLGCAVLSFGVFIVGVVLWFASGNMIAPVVAWLGAAIVAGLVPLIVSADTTAVPWPEFVESLRLWIPLLCISGFVFKIAISTKVKKHHQRLDVTSPVEHKIAKVKPDTSSFQAVAAMPVREELSVANLQKMRGLLDRSLQPVEKFEGFDWIDQFQTASIRYQINFVSYALSIASAVHLPAAQGYMHTAQSNLAHKLLDHRVWGYWQLENIWGNLRTSADPVTRDNIMLSGFLSAQFSLARGLVGLTEFDDADSLVFRKASGQEFRYSLAQINRDLQGHYQDADYGLLACEPNWVFPLCNSITATGLRALDTQTGSTDWDLIAARFEKSLHNEFISPNGLLVPFRSSRTGIAAPMIGGGAMQTLPCFFLNALLPDMAAQQWELARRNLTKAKGRRAMWPVDIGNYRLNRSASYGACAAAAVEMGDQDTAQRIFDYLDEDYPAVLKGGVAHRPDSSLWAHALEFSARAGAHNALQLATTTTKADGPVITKVDYPDLLLAAAHSVDGCLKAVMYPGVRPGVKSISIAGLLPNKTYQSDSATAVQVTADRNGEVELQLTVDGRTELNLKPLS